MPRRNQAASIADLADDGALHLDPPISVARIADPTKDDASPLAGCTGYLHFGGYMAGGIAEGTANHAR